jgi:hypothetical protein
VAAAGEEEGGGGRVTTGWEGDGEAGARDGKSSLAKSGPLDGFPYADDAAGTATPLKLGFESGYV